MLVYTIAEVRQKVREWKKAGLTIGLVPTMGALHDGHKSLITKSVSKCDKTIVSVFVNPIQFCAGEDLDKYPRTLNADNELCEQNGVDIVFAPSAKEMYGDDYTISHDYLTYVIPPSSYVNKLCGKSRIGHFDGVCTVVNKLFNIAEPDYAFFGEKDRQQLIVLQKMVKDLNIPLQIIPCPTVREESGLALSSRNKYLSAEDKENALALSKILFHIKDCYNNGVTDIKSLSAVADIYLNESHALEYLDFRDSDDLTEKQIADNKTIVFIALKIGDVRLIDNLALKD